MSSSPESATPVSATVGADTVSGTRFSALENLFAALFEKSGASRWGISVQQFTGILLAVSAKYLPADATETEIRQFCESLHVEELALARACAAGQEAAWEVFLTRYRARLFTAAYAIAKEESAARELADSIYAELYGVNTRAGVRISKLTFYMGRGSLEGWLRTVLAQEYVNRYRSGKRLVSLDAENKDRTEAGLPPVELVAAHPDPPRVIDERVEIAIDAALAALAAEERLILASYFLDGRTLAEIARMLDMHESTISRKIEKLTRTLRNTIIKRLIASGLSRRKAEEALEIDVRDVAINIRASLTQDSSGNSFHVKERGP